MTLNMAETDQMALGFLDVHNRDGLCYCARLGHGELTPEEAKRLLHTIAWRADVYEEALCGVDIY